MLYFSLMTIFESMILGVIVGISEFLPISSTGHLILANELLGIAAIDFSKSFDIIIQLGAILAVVVLYYKRFTDPWTLKKLLVAFIPTGIIGFGFYAIVKTFFLGNLQVVLWSLLIGGLLMLVFEYFYQDNLTEADQIEKISFKQAFIIGVFQAVAIIPGVSRSAATIIGGMIVGLRRKTIVEFSFLLAVPTMLAATGLDLWKNASSFSTGQFQNLAIGFVTSFAVALISIKLLIAYVRNHTFTPFAIYRIALALVFFLVIF